MDDASYRRYVHVNLPHARTVCGRIGRTLEALRAFGQGNGGASALRNAFGRLEGALLRFDEDPPAEQALASADAVAELARGLVAAIVEARASSDRLGQHVRNLFECLALAEEGALLSLSCGERPDSALR